MRPGQSISWVLALVVAAACGTATPKALTTGAAATAPSIPSAAPTTNVPAASPPPAPSATKSAAGAVQTVATGEVVKLSGNSYTTSDTFRFSSDTTLDITWNYTGTAPFALWLINVSENVTDPNYDRILMDDVMGPHAGTASQKIIAGDWTIQVEQAGGPWVVQFTPES